MAMTALPERYWRSDGHDARHPDNPKHAIPERGTAADVDPILSRVDVSYADHKGGSKVGGKVS